jgi:hypothetical protein
MLPNQGGRYRVFELVGISLAVSPGLERKPHSISLKEAV